MASEADRQARRQVICLQAVSAPTEVLKHEENYKNSYREQCCETAEKSSERFVFYRTDVFAFVGIICVEKDFEFHKTNIHYFSAQINDFEYVFAVEKAKKKNKTGKRRGKDVSVAGNLK